jgi:hypothetical protein
MHSSTMIRRFWFATVAAAFVFGSLRTHAQGTGYSIKEQGAPPDTTATANATAGPVRMARFSFVQG